MNTVTQKQIEKITETLAARAADIRYEVTIPSRVQSEVSDAFVEYWEGIVDDEPGYIEFEHEEVQACLIGDTLDAIMEYNENTELDNTWLEVLLSKGATFTFDDLQVAYMRAIVDDMASAWVQEIRDIFEEVCGFDPASEAIDWESADTE